MSVVERENLRTLPAPSRVYGTCLDARGQLLVVEDDPDIRDTLAEALAWEGYDVTTASNGLEALELLRGGLHADVILLDLMMPVMSGWEFRRVQQDDPALAGIPVVVLSASSPGNARPDRYLAKPFRIEDLLSVLGELQASPLAA
jgi:CheY-like chemotaxis protein